MQNQFTRVIRVRLYRIVIAVLFILMGVCVIAYLETKAPKIEAILAGLATGLFIALIQYLLDWNEHVEIETIKKLGIRRVLAHRDERPYYQRLIGGSQREILVLGNTASRLLEDFAHPERTDSATLLEALGRGVKVRLLLPKPAYLSTEDRARATEAARRMAEIAQKSPGFSFRFFDHAPAHSLMRIDDECLVGPIFARVKSKDSPAIHVDAESPFAVEYLKYFEEEWNGAEGS